MTRQLAPSGPTPAPGPVAVIAMWLALSSIVLGGCALFEPRGTSAPVVPDRDEPTADAGAEEVELEPPPPDIERQLEADELLALGDTLLAEGDPAGAATIYRELVEVHPASDEAARALFQLAALQLDPASPIYHVAGAVTTLERIGEDHPASPWAPAAGLMLELTRQNADLERTLRTLEAQLDELKKLDLAADPSDG